MQNLTLELSIDEVNVILEALGAMPYVKVFGVIDRIQQQAREQVVTDSGSGGEIAAQRPTLAAAN